MSPTDVELVYVSYNQDGTIAERDGIRLPHLDWGNREATTTYKSVKYTRAERLRASRDENLPFDLVYSCSFRELRKPNKDEFHRFYDKYAADTVWFKDVEGVWHYGYILNSSVVITDVRDPDDEEQRLHGKYELEWDFIEIPPVGINPVCSTIVYSQYMIDNDVWNMPEAPFGSTNWTIEFEPFGMSTILTGTGNAGDITMNSTDVPGWNVPSTQAGCPVMVRLTYYCETSPLEAGVQFVSVNAEEDFVYIAKNTSNTEQLKILDIILKELGRDPDTEVSNWNEIYTEFQAFLLANPDYILDVSNMGLTSTSIFSTFTNLRGLNASHNLLGMTDLNKIDDYGIALVYIDLSYNNLGGDAGRRIESMKPSLKHIDLSHNLLQEYYLYEKDQNGVTNGPTPFLVDYYNISFNNLVFGSNGGARIKQFYMTDNTYPLGELFNNPNSFLAVSNLGTHMQDAEIIDLSNTSIRYSYNDPTNVNQVETEITTLLNTIVAAGHTLDEAKQILVRNPKWEVVEANTPHEPYNNNLIYVATSYVSYQFDDSADGTLQLENNHDNIELESSTDLIALE